MTIIVDSGETLKLYSTFSPAPSPPGSPITIQPAEPVGIPHLALPLRYTNGVPATNEQDSIDDIAACIEAVIRHPKGHRPEQPDFGVTDPTFRQGGADLDQLRADVVEWEDRAELLFDRDPDRLTGLVDEIAVTVGG